MPNRSWTIDTAHSGVHFTVRHMVITKVRGTFRSWTGTLSLDEADLARSSVDVAIDAASIDTRNDDRDGHLRSADFFDVENFPQLTFRSSRIERTSEIAYRVVGELAIRGTTREVVLDANLDGRMPDADGNDRISFTARTELDRRDFGLTWNQLLGAGNVLVGDKVEIGIELQAYAAAAAEVAA
jgi:polyisoprenoid-binding protein YceI